MMGLKKTGEKRRGLRDNQPLGLCAVLIAAIALALLAISTFDVNWNNVTVLHMNKEESTLAHGLWAICQDELCRQWDAEMCTNAPQLEGFGSLRISVDRRDAKANPARDFDGDQQPGWKCLDETRSYSGENILTMVTNEGGVYCASIDSHTCMVFQADQCRPLLQEVESGKLEQYTIRQMTCARDDVLNPRHWCGLAFQAALRDEKLEDMKATMNGLGPVIGGENVFDSDQDWDSDIDESEDTMPEAESTETTGTDDDVAIPEKSSLLSIPVVQKPPPTHPTIAPAPVKKPTPGPEAIAPQRIPSTSGLKHSLPGTKECQAYIAKVQGVRIGLLAAFVVGSVAFALTLAAAVLGNEAYVHAQWAGYSLMAAMAFISVAVYGDASNKYHVEDDWSFGYAYRLGWAAVVFAVLAVAMAMLFPANRLLGRAKSKDFKPAFPSVPWPALMSSGGVVGKGGQEYTTYLKEKRAQAGGMPSEMDEWDIGESIFSRSSHIS